MDKDKFLSVIAPVYNEEGNIRKLHEEIQSSCNEMIRNNSISRYEIIFINDGSTDSTQKILEDIRKKDKFFHFIEFRKNFGQTPALKAGFDIAQGDYVVTLDSDLQNDPADISKLLNKLNEGYDVVSGWRWQRRDPFGKRVSSKIMNFLRKKLLKDELHDYGCALKIYRRECIKDLQLFGELHRYITGYLSIKGYKIAEVKVNHRERKSGKTKYSWSRATNGFLDLLYLKFWASFSDRPLHFFGRLGLYQWMIAVIIVLEQIIKALIVKELTFGPLMALSLLLVITGLLSIIFGFLSEMMARIYFKDEKIYSVKKAASQKEIKLEQIYIYIYIYIYINSRII